MALCLRWSRGLAALALLFLVACRSGPGPLDADPLTAARDDRLTAAQRAAMVERAWADASADRTNRRAVRRDLKDLAWVVQHPAKVRLAALRALASDTDPGAEEDTRSTVFFMLPLEPDPSVTEYLAELAASRGWSDTTPSLVRSLSRPGQGADRERPEYRALSALHPGRRVEEVVYDVFLNPPPKAALAGVVSPERVRADAWDLLRRLDADGSVRARLLEDAGGTGGDPSDVLRRSLRELRVLPTTGDEYLWLVSLAGSDAARAAWWGSTSAIVQRLDQARVGRLSIRHLEAIRFTAAADPQRLERTREELRSEVSQRLAGRTVVLRQRERGQVGANRPERFEASADRLSWGDLITLLAVDDALADPTVRAALFAQRENRRAEGFGLSNRPYRALTSSTRRTASSSRAIGIVPSRTCASSVW
ncbi:hypothetical protein J4558_03095 [Leptolyngbya sp. 15MV]|nr:hypothetical protein J4558_03095 [Leptolyngbya sp. 15MV]